MTRTLQLSPSVRRWLAQRLARPAAAAPAPRRRRACLYKVDRLGDFVLSTGALHTLVKHFGAAECRLVVSADAAPLAAMEFPELERWVAPAHTTGVWREMWPLRRRLAPVWASEQFDDLICLRHARSLHRDLTLSWLHAGTWHGLGVRPTGATLSLENRPKPAAGYPEAAKGPWCRELAAHRTLLTRLLGREVSWSEIRPQLQKVPVENRRDIVLCPFGGEPIRDYPQASWLPALAGVSTVCVLGPAERREELDSLAARLGTTGIKATAMAGVAPEEFIRRIAEARLVVTVESAAAHLATALDQPAVIVTGGGHFGRYAPWGESPRQRWVHHPLACYDCNWQCRRPRVECLEDLPPTAVATAIAEVMPHD